jgi:hypothetical protein
MGFIAGLDLGQSMDYSALVIVERQQPPREETVRGSTPPPARYAVRHLTRWDLGTPYPQMVREVTDLLTHPPLVADYKLLVDYTGCGRPVVDMLKPTFRTEALILVHF